jgi:hypothetical protein
MKRWKGQWQYLNIDDTRRYRTSREGYGGKEKGREGVLEEGRKEGRVRKEEIVKEGRKEGTMERVWKK